MITGCRTCDDQTPGMPTTLDAARDLHRAMHDFGRAVQAAVRPLLDRLERLLRPL